MDTRPRADLRIPRAKVHRARERAAQALAGFDEWVTTAVGFRQEYRAKERHHAVIVDVRAAPPEAAVLDLGEAVAHLRTALDHVTYQLAIHQAGSDPPPDATRLAFPIADDLPRWERFVAQRLSALDAAALDTLRRWQPFEHPGGAADSRMRCLRELDDIVKHRRPAIIAVTFGQELGIGGNTTLTLAGLPSDALRAGDDFLLFVDAEPGTVVQVETSLVPAFDEPTALSVKPPLPISETMDLLIEVVDAVITDVAPLCE
ncbi:MAG: hypothetical protein KF809_14835 [Chloroflexi bacterium]|nr:hypothetical protein [Chloroflexota bacterium]